MLETLDASFIPIVWKSPQNFINLSLNAGVNQNGDYLAPAASRRFYPTIFILTGRLSVSEENLFASIRKFVNADGDSARIINSVKIYSAVLLGKVFVNGFSRTLPMTVIVNNQNRVGRQQRREMNQLVLG